MSMNHMAFQSRQRSRGMSLVELMVGIAVGLFIVAGAALMASSQLTDNRALLLETQLQQDLRATADFIARDLRRSGSSINEVQGRVPVPDDTQPRTTSNNGYQTPPVIEGDELSYAYVGTGTPPYPGAYRVRLANNVIETCRSQATDWECTNESDASGWQPLTDINVVKITAFSISANQVDDRARTANGTPIALPCPNLCTLDPTNGGATTCWPTAKVHELVVWITGESAIDSRITRTMKSTVRVRNPVWRIATAVGTIPAGSSCPDLPYVP